MWGPSKLVCFMPTFVGLLVVVACSLHRCDRVRGRGGRLGVSLCLSAGCCGSGEGSSCGIMGVKGDDYGSYTHC